MQILTLFRDVHELDCDFLFRYDVLAQHHLAEPALANDLSDFVLVENSAIVELLAVQRNVEHIVILNKLNILIEYFKPIFVVQLRCPQLVFLIECAAR